MTGGYNGLQGNTRGYRGLQRDTGIQNCDLISNHKLAIETGRYSRPFKKPAERICPICKIEMEDEYHFLNICPPYQKKRCSLLDYLVKEYRIK